MLKWSESAQKEQVVLYHDLRRTASYLIPIRSVDRVNTHRCAQQVSARVICFNFDGITDPESFFSLYLTVVTLEYNVVGDEKKITQ